MRDDTLLLVEDDDDIRDNLAFLLERRGYRVAVAQHGKEALDLLHDGLKPCVVILDLMMPVMDGWQFRTEMLKDPSYASIPAIILSGMADIHRVAQPFGPHEHLAKPVELDVLCDTVNRLC